MSDSRAVQTQVSPRLNNLRVYLNEKGLVQKIRASLPRNLPPERLIRQTLSLCEQNPGLLDCTPTSIFDGIVRAAELGLELSGPLGHAYLVPRRNTRKGCQEATFQIGYRGLIALAYRSGRVRALHLRVVHENEPFRIRMGTIPGIDHAPVLDRPAGAPVAYYAYAELDGGGSDFEVMSRPQAEEHRDRYAARKGKGSPWEEQFDEMALKTVARKLCKRLPMASEMVEAVVRDEYDDAGVFAGAGPVLDPSAALPAPAVPSRTEQVAGQIAGEPPEGPGLDERLNEAADRGDAWEPESEEA